MSPVGPLRAGAVVKPIEDGPWRKAAKRALKALRIRKRHPRKVLTTEGRRTRWERQRNQMLDDAFAETAHHMKAER